MDDAPATKKDLTDLGKDLREDLADLGKDLREDLAALRKDTKKAQTDSEERLVTVMREIETKLLRGFFDYAESTDLRLRKLKADVSNIDAVTEQRVDRLEYRIRLIEHRLDFGDNPTAPPLPPQQ
jgi:hypothetical protein